MPFFIIFVIIPLTEIAVFIKVGEKIGLFDTLLLCLLSAVIGGLILRHQGMRVFQEGLETLNGGRFPGSALFDGFCLVIAGACMITPGFVTDAIGLCLLIPAVRRILQAYLTSRMDIDIVETEFFREERGSDDSGAIEGHFERIDRDGRDNKS